MNKAINWLLRLVGPLATWGADLFRTIDQLFASARSAETAHPQLEVLERRVVLASLLWVGGHELIPTDMRLPMNWRQTVLIGKYFAVVPYDRPIQATDTLFFTKDSNNQQPILGRGHLEVAGMRLLPGFTGTITLADKMTTLLLSGQSSELHIPESYPNSQFVSRHHCMLDITPPIVRLRDLGSKNGTFVNNTLLACRPDAVSPTAARDLDLPERDLKHGDEFHLAKSAIAAFRIEITSPPRCTSCSAILPQRDAVAHNQHPNMALCPSCQARATSGEPGSGALASAVPTPNTCFRCHRPSPGGSICADCRRAIAEQADPDFVAIPGYQILRLLGKGGMGAVYLARHNSSGREVAFKVMLPEQATADAHRRFQREMHLLRSLRHPHIVRFLDCGWHQGICFLTMEPCDGGTVANLLQKRGRPLPLDEAIEITLQSLSGLHHAHTALPGCPIVHRDLKPGNILFQEGVLMRDYRLIVTNMDGQCRVSCDVGDLGEAGPISVPSDSLQAAVAQGVWLNQGDRFERDKVAKIGVGLFQAFLPSEVGERFRKAQTQSAQERRQLRLLIQYPPNDSHLHQVPWEVLHDGKRHLALSSEVVLTRYLRQAREVRSLRVDGPIQVFHSSACPSGAERLEFTDEMTALRRLAESPDFRLRSSEGASLPVVQRALCDSAQPVHIWHHSGHGKLEPGKRFLLLLQRDGKAEEVPGDVFRDLPELCPELRLAVLAICHGAADLGLATLLAGVNVPAVIGFRTRVRDVSAGAFTQALYQGVLSKPLEEAMRDARVGLATSDRPLDWAIPLLFLRTTDSVLRPAPVVAPQPPPVQQGLAALLNQQKPRGNKMNINITGSRVKNVFVGGTVQVGGDPSPNAAETDMSVNMENTEAGNVNVVGDLSLPAEQGAFLLQLMATLPEVPG